MPTVIGNIIVSINFQLPNTKLPVSGGKCVRAAGQKGGKADKTSYKVKEPELE